MRRQSCDEGFTLAEVCVAMLLLVVTSTGAARLISLSVSAAQAARLQTTTTALASQKIEALRALIWPDPALQDTPADSLERNASGSVEFLDARGGVAGTAANPPPGARFIRRWTIGSLSEDPLDAIVVTVLVTTIESDRRAHHPRQRLAGDALITTILWRQTR